ncbi:MAG: class I SAM-dependent methyltransferase [Pseudomonadota bacterium]
MNKALRAPSKISRRLLKRGPVDTSRWLWSHIDWRRRERRLNIETETPVGAAEMGFKANCHGYEPISYASFDIVTDHLKIDPDHDCFLDYGCGKGRAIILAALQPFKQVIGVELSRELCDAAEKNIDSARSKLRCQDVRVICADAARFALPSEVTVIFLWNSFKGEILSQVHENIRQSLIDRPRRLTLVNSVPHGEEDAMARLDWLPDGKLLPTEFFTGIDVVIYEANCGA